MLSFMLSVTYKPYMLSIVMVSVVMLSVVMLNVVAPFTRVNYGPCKISYEMHIMHAPVQCFQKALNVLLYSEGWMAKCICTKLYRIVL